MYMVSVCDCIYTCTCDIAFNTRPDLGNDHIESVWIEILLPKTKPILVGVCYRPPKQMDFYEKLENICSNTERFFELEVMILGDFNTNFLKHPTLKSSTLYVSMNGFMNMFNLQQLITTATRVTATCKSIIDLIFVSDPDKISQSGVIELGLSDHFGTYCTRKISKSQTSADKVSVIRNMKNYSSAEFCTMLSRLDWSSVFSCNDVNQAFQNFKDLFLNCVDTLAPKKEVRLKQRSEPWLTNEILETIKERDKTLSAFMKTKIQSVFDDFKRLRNKVQTLVKKAKLDFYKHELEVNKNSPKKLWKILGSLGVPSKSNKTPSSAIGLDINGSINFDKFTVAEKFNEFFSTVASKLVTKLPKALGRFSSAFYYSFYADKGATLNSFELQNLTEKETLGLLRGLGRDKATGLDNIPARFLRDGAIIIANPLTHIINLSISTGTVPEDMKSARVVPLHKKNSKTDTGNYRPVSILSCISKVLERAVYNQIELFLNKNNLLYELQSGFRPGFSTDTTLTFLTDYIRGKIDKGDLTGLVLLDLQKAFDTVDHNILLSKLSAVGLNLTSVNWFKSYLTQRSQLVEVEGTRSETRNVTCGVPQGSILGPLLFLIYVNDMQKAVNCKLLLYADDSCLLVSGKNVQDIENTLSHELQNVSDWLVDNKLSLHLGKTESIIFGSHKRLKNKKELNVVCNGVKIDSKPNVNYLGTKLDQTLSGETTANSVISKCNSRLKFLYRKANYFDFTTRRNLAMALIQCHFDYACSAWYGGLKLKLKQRLQICQNKMIRYVLGLHPRSHIGYNEFKIVNWLPVEKRVQQLNVNHMFKIFNNTAPSYLSEQFERVQNQHHYRTRGSSHNFIVPGVNSAGRSSFSFVGAKNWNNLPGHIKQCITKENFKLEVKKYFMECVANEEEAIYLY